MDLMQEKISRLESKNEKLLKKEEKITNDLKREEEAIGHEFTEKERKIFDLQRKVKSME
jgi:hypothetical protein